MKLATLDIAEQPDGNRVQIDCKVDWDHGRRCWRASDDIGSEAFDDDASRAVLRCFAIRLGIPFADAERAARIAAALSADE